MFPYSKASTIKPQITRSIICIPHGEKQDKTEASEDRINRYKYLIFR